MAKLTHEIIDITPDIASKWLKESEFNNRNISRDNLNKICSDIEKGMWVFDGNPIRFNGDGDVIDGQHRLTAIIRTGKTVKSLVIKGIADRAKLTIDTGNQRKVSDILHFDGHKNVSALASAARLLAATEQFDGDLLRYVKLSRRSYSQQTINDVVESHPEIHDSIAYINNKKTATKLLGKGVASYLHYIISKSKHGHMANEFFDKFDSGLGLEDGSPIGALRNSLMTGNQRHISGATYIVMKCASTIKAWNYFVKDGKVKYIRYSLTETFPTLIG